MSCMGLRLDGLLMPDYKLDRTDYKKQPVGAVLTEEQIAEANRRHDAEMRARGIDINQFSHLKSGWKSTVIGKSSRRAAMYQERRLKEREKNPNS
jgi:hypothetical protein